MSELDLGSNLNSSDFEEIIREDGQKQITFKGWPLYYFSPEGDGVLEETNNTQGDGRSEAFFIAKPDYSIMIGRQLIGEEEEAISYLVDDRGVSLYFTTGDEENISNCSGGCASVWPPFVAPNNLVLPSTLSIAEFSTTNRNDDLGPQLTVTGNPIYRFSQDDLIRGSVLGQAGGPNANFFVMNP